MKKINLKKVLAAFIALVCIVSLASCSLLDNNDEVTENNVNGDAVVLTLGDIEVKYDEFRYFYLNNKLSMDGGDTSYWTNNPDKIEELKTNTLQSICTFHAISTAAAANSVEADEEQLKATEDIVEQYIAVYGEEEFENMLEQSYFTLDLFKELYTITSLESTLYTKLVESDNILDMTKEEALAILNGDEYIRAMHILYADEATAKGILETAKAATDDEFYELAQAAEDPGMVGNESGYVFTYGEMVEPFEEASFALEVGETSELVKSDFGYHIIRRLEKTPEFVEENYDTLASTLLQNAYYEYLDTFTAELEAGAEYTAEYEKLDFLVK